MTGWFWSWGFAVALVTRGCRDGFGRWQGLTDPLPASISSVSVAFLERHMFLFTIPVDLLGMGQRSIDI